MKIVAIEQLENGFLVHIRDSEVPTYLQPRLFCKNLKEIRKVLGQFFAIEKPEVVNPI